MGKFKFNSDNVPSELLTYVDNSDPSTVVVESGKWLGLNREGKAVDINSSEARLYAFNVKARGSNRINDNSILGFDVIMTLGAVFELDANEILEPLSSITVGDDVGIDTSFGGLSINSTDTVGTILSITQNDGIWFRIDNINANNNNNTVSIDPSLDTNGDDIVDKYELREAVLDIDEDNDTDIHDVIDIINNQALN